MNFYNGLRIVGINHPSASTLQVDGYTFLYTLPQIMEDSVVVVQPNGKLGQRELNFNKVSAVVGSGVCEPLVGGTGLTELGGAGYLLRTKLDGSGMEWVAPANNRNWEVAQDVKMNVSNYDNTQLSEEETQDRVGAMFAAGTQTGMTIEYDDETGALN